MPVTENPVKNVVVHPLVLLSVVDHFTRMSKIGNQKRVVGVLLGGLRSKGVLDVSNSFAGVLLINQESNSSFSKSNICYLVRSPTVPFDEDEKDKSVWFLDHDYLENMSTMFKKVNGMKYFSTIDSVQAKLP